MGVCAQQNIKLIKTDSVLQATKSEQERLSNESLQLQPKQCIRRQTRSSTTNQLQEIKKKRVIDAYELQRGFLRKYTVLKGKGNDQTLYCQNNQTTQLTNVTILEKFTTQNHSYFQEIQLYDLKCINISQYIESYQDEDHIYLVQEQLKGGNLSQVLKKKHLTYHQALVIIEQIINALYHLHTQNLTHGSLTIDSFTFSDPENLLVKLSDLGPIFNCQNPNKKQISQYASPENQKSAKSDVWSIGIIFYQLITSNILDILTDYTDIPNWDPSEGLNIPKKGIKCLIDMLQYDSKRRCTLSHIINKGYFKNEINQETIISCSIQLGQLQKMTELQQILIQFMMYRFQSEQVQILSRVFQHADQDKDGSISKNELKNLLHEIHLEEQFVNKIIESVFSILNGGNLSKDKFITLASNKQELLVDYNIEQTYKLISNYQGGITVKSISQHMTITNEAEIRDEIFSEFTINQSNMVLFQKFIKLVL